MLLQAILNAGDAVLGVGWLELPASYAEGLFKGAGHKYIKRVPSGTTKSGKVRYRYFYHVGHGGTVANAEHFVVGASFKGTTEGKQGHWHITGTGAGPEKDLLVIRHDETGKSTAVSRKYLRTMMLNGHADGLKAHEAKIMTDWTAAHANGASDKQKAKIRARATAAGIGATKLRNAADVATPAAKPSAAKPPAPVAKPPADLWDYQHDGDRATTSDVPHAKPTPPPISPRVAAALAGVPAQFHDNYTDRTPEDLHAVAASTRRTAEPREGVLRRSREEQARVEREADATARRFEDVAMAKHRDANDDMGPHVNDALNLHLVRQSLPDLGSILKQSPDAIYAMADKARAEARKAWSGGNTDDRTEREMRMRALALTEIGNAKHRDAGNPDAVHVRDIAARLASEAGGGGKGKVHVGITSDGNVDVATSTKAWSGGYHHATGSVTAKDGDDYTAKAVKVIAKLRAEAAAHRAAKAVETQKVVDAAAKARRERDAWKGPLSALANAIGTL